MTNNILLLALLSCVVLVSVQAWVIVTDRVKDRVIHVESLMVRGHWLWQHDHYDSDGSRYAYFDPCAERDTYYTPRVQFETKVCGQGVCLESLSLRNHYLTAGYVPGDDIKVVKLQYSTYTLDDNRFHWRILCTSENMEKCKFVALRFLTPERERVIVADGPYNGHYDAAIGYVDDSLRAYVRIHAPNPTDGRYPFFDETNEGYETDQAFVYKQKIGVSKTLGTTETITSTTSLEIGAAFKAFSSSASTTIEKTWMIEESTTFEMYVEIEQHIIVPKRHRIILYQLKGLYDDEFYVGAHNYTIKSIDLDLNVGPTRTRQVKLDL